MSNGNILFIDNDEMFLETRTIYLNRAGYKVFLANTLDEAAEQIELHFIQLIIVDVRAIDDNDVHDKSGLEFARRSEYSKIPKIILTNEPDRQDQRKALVGSSTSNWIVAARDYLAKEDGAEEMVRAVQRIFKDYIALNQELKISWKQLSAVELLGKIEPELGSEEITERLAEMEALIKIVFNKFAYVTISQILTGSKKSPKLLAYAQNRSGHFDKFFVEIGRLAYIENAIRQYNAALQRNRFETGFFFTEKSLEGTTPRYGAIGWTFRGIGPSQYYVTFKTMMRNRSQAEIEQILQNLFEQTIDPWQSLSGTDLVRLVDLFLQSQKLDEFAGDLFTTTARMIEQRATQLSMNDLMVGLHGALQFDFDIEGAVPEPLLNLDELIEKVVKKTTEAGQVNLKKGVVHNKLGRESIFFDHDGKGWLIGFDQTELDQFLIVDTIKFAQNLRAVWSAHMSPVDWYQLELAALQGTAGDRPEMENPFWSKMIAILGEIQAFAETTDDLTSEEFLTALFWANVGELSQLKQHHLRACDEVQGAINLLISTQLIGQRLLSEAKPQATSIMIDHANQAVQIGENITELTPQEHNVLSYLHDHANQAVTRLDLANNVFGANYEMAPSEKDFIEYNRITMTLKRLREKIDEDGSLGLISTVRGKGYRLNLPEDPNNNVQRL